MRAKSDKATVVGVGAVACAVCCAGPILGALSALGIGTVAGTVVFGAGALVVAAFVAVLLVARRRINRRLGREQERHTCAADASCCETPSEVPVAITARRSRP